VWNALFEKYSNVFIVGNLTYIYENMKLYEDLWYMIPTRKIQVNDGLFAMRTQSMQEAKAEENWLESGVISAQLPGNTIFIFTSRSLAESYLRHAPPLSNRIRELDGIYYLLWDKSLVDEGKLSSLILKWSACDLAVVGTNAQVNRETCEVTNLAGRSGPVTYGPHTHLSQGNYSLEIEYTGTSSAPTADVGVWDVYTEKGRLGISALPNTNGNRMTYRGTLA
jgi:hypothetical protein